MVTERLATPRTRGTAHQAGSSPPRAGSAFTELPRDALADRRNTKTHVRARGGAALSRRAEPLLRVHRATRRPVTGAIMTARGAAAAQVASPRVPRLGAPESGICARLLLCVLRGSIARDVVTGPRILTRARATHPTCLPLRRGFRPTRHRTSPSSPAPAPAGAGAAYRATPQSTRKCPRNSLPGFILRPGQTIFPRQCPPPPRRP